MADPFLSYCVSIGVRIKQIFMFCDVTLFHGWLSHEIRTTVYGQQIPIVQVADTGIPTAASANRAETADPLEILFQHKGIVIEMITVSALALTRCFLFAGTHPFTPYIPM